MIQKQEQNWPSKHPVSDISELYKVLHLQTALGCYSRLKAVQKIINLSPWEIPAAHTYCTSAVWSKSEGKQKRNDVTKSIYNTWI